MNVIVCVDKSKGMLFNGRRQSQDKLLREKVLALCSGSFLWLNEYTAKQFEKKENIIIDNDFMCKASTGEFCFVENSKITIESVEKFYVFNWNRDYPSDTFFDIDLKGNGFKKVFIEDFVGNSHEKITLEVFEKVIV